MNLRFALLLALACGPSAPEQVEEVRLDPPAPREDVPEPERELLTRSRPYMGTVFRISVNATADVGGPAIRRAFEEIGRLETVLSEWREDSEISRINQQAGIAPVRVSEDVFRVVKAGVDVSRWSDGAFDLSWAALRGLYDFRPGRQRIPDRREVRPRLRLIDWTAIEIDEEARTVFLKNVGMAIGTGGIAKGYALDRAGAILRGAGIESYMLFGGGQVQVHGLRPDPDAPGGGRPWRVGIQHPRREDHFAFFEIDGGSVSTSGDYEHVFIDPQGKRWHHILNPRTGLPVDQTVSVTLIAPEGLYADALSTAAFVLGPRRALEMLERIELEAQVVMLDDDCRLFGTEAATGRLRYRIELEGGVLPGCH